MIPKTIHYCWFGRGEMPKLMKKCIKSWEKYCPDYKIVEWNEDNFDVNSTVWTKQAYEAKKYAFVADYVRLKVLYEHGGVYLDTDQELIKPLGPFMEHNGFIGFMNMTDQSRKGIISAGVIGVDSTGAGHELIRELLDYYDGRSFLVDEKSDILPNTDIITEIFKKNGLVPNEERQDAAGFAVYPPTVFCPTSCVSIHDCQSSDTVALHHWAMTWRTEKARKDFARLRRHQRKWYRTLEKARYLPNRAARKIFGDERMDKLKSKLKH